jgi:hypothetical protein
MAITIDDLPCEECRRVHQEYGHTGLTDCCFALNTKTTQEYIREVLSRCNKYKPKGYRDSCKHGPVFEHWQEAHPEMWTMALLSLGVDNDD